MSGEAIVTRIDHLSAAVSNPEEIFAILTEGLGLPPLWAPAPFAGFISGGVSLGNVFLETILWAPGHKSRLPHDVGAVCVALEPADLASAPPALDQRGIPHSAPYPYSGSVSRTPTSSLLPWEAGSGPLYTTMMLGGLMGDEVLARRYLREARTPRATRIISSATSAVSTRSLRIGNALMPWVVPPAAWAFFCDWKRLDIARSRAISRDLLEDANGGTLGVTGVRELVIGVPDLAAESRRWDALLAPLRADQESRWTFEHGPAIRVQESGSGPWQRLVVEVGSLERAREVLEERGMLAAESGGEMRIEPRRIGGIDIRLRSAA